MVVSTIDRPRKMYSPRPPAPIAAAMVAVPTPMTVATRMPATIDGSASGSSHQPQQLARRHAHRDAGLDDRAVEAAQPGDGRADDRQQRVEGQRDERRARPDAADERQRQQESEQRQARDRLRDVRQTSRSGAAQRGPARGEDAGRDADRHRDRGRDEHQHQMLPHERAQLAACDVPEVDERRIIGRPPAGCERPASDTVEKRRTRGSVDAATAAGVSQAISSPASSTPTRVAERERLADVVRHEDDGRAAARFWMRRELAPELGARDRIERAERLVHQQDRRIDRQRARDADPLPLAARQLVRPARRERPPPAGRPGRAVRARARVMRAGRPAARAAGRAATFSLDGHVGEEADVLEHVADAAPERNRGPTRACRGLRPRRGPAAAAAAG